MVMSSRRRIRVPCSVKVGDRVLEGFSRNLSESSVYILVPPELESTELWVGRALRLRGRLRRTVGQ